jgi:hypothetical protein
MNVLLVLNLQGRSPRYPLDRRLVGLRNQYGRKLNRYFSVALPLAVTITTELSCLQRLVTYLKHIPNRLSTIHIQVNLPSKFQVQIIFLAARDCHQGLSLYELSLRWLVGVAVRLEFQLSHATPCHTTFPRGMSAVSIPPHPTPPRRVPRFEIWEHFHQLIWPRSNYIIWVVYWELFKTLRFLIWTIQLFSYRCFVPFFVNFYYNYFYLQPCLLGLSFATLIRVTFLQLIRFSDGLLYFFFKFVERLWSTHNHIPWDFSSEILLLRFRNNDKDSGHSV